jgi:hypothetical protein
MRIMKSSSLLASGHGSSAPCGAVAARAALALAGLLVTSTAAVAQGAHLPDADGDGLVYAQEMVLGTSPIHDDTDRDGFSDLEEIARHSSPRLASSRPDPMKRIGIGMTVHAQTNGVHVLVPVFMSDMDLRSKKVEIGLLAHGQLVQLSNAYLAAHATLTYHPASVSSGCIALIDLVIDPNVIHTAGQLSVYAKAGVPGASGCTSAAAVHLLSMGGIVVYSMPAPSELAANLPKDNPQAHLTSASIYVPLLPSPDGNGTGGNGSGSGSGGVGSTWEPGEVCFQRAAPVATDGATVTNEIVDAGCTTGWEGFCPANCGSSVGSTYRTVDPLALIGG